MKSYEKRPETVLQQACVETHDKSEVAGNQRKRCRDNHHHQHEKCAIHLAWVGLGWTEKDRHDGIVEVRQVCTEYVRYVISQLLLAC